MVRSLGLKSGSIRTGIRRPTANKQRVFDPTIPADAVGLIAVLAGVGIGAGALSTRVGHPPTMPSLTVLLLLVLALTLAGRLTVAFRYRGEVDALDAFEAALTPAVALVPGPRLILLVAVAKLGAQLWLRMPGSKLAFNVAQWIACTGLASITFAALSHAGASAPQRLGALAAAMLVVVITNTAAVAVLFVLLGDAPRLDRVFHWPELGRSLVMTLVMVATGVATAMAAEQKRGALLALFGLLLLLHWAGRGYALQEARSDQWQCLQSATHTLSASVDPRENAAAFLDDVCRCCKAQSAELALNRRGAPEVYRVGPGPRSPSAAELRTAELPLHVVGVPRATGWRGLLAWLRGRSLRSKEAFKASAPTADSRDCLAVPVLCDDARVGVLAVYNRTGLAELDAADLTVLQALAQELSAALQRAELIDQALSARDSAARIIAGSNDGIVAIAEDGSVVAWNPALAEMTGRATEQMIGGSVSVLDARDASGRPIRLEGWAHGGPLPMELQIRAQDGSSRWVSCSYAEDTDRWHGGRMLVVMVRDVTELRRQRALVAGQAQILELIASDEPSDTSLRAIARFVASQLDGATVSVLSAEREQQGRSMIAFTEPSPDVALPRELTNDPELWTLRPKDGRPIICASDSGGEDATYWAMPVPEEEHSEARALLLVRPHRAAALTDQAVQVLRTAARLTDVCLSREEARARLAHQASHDALTGLPNRALFLDRCWHALRDAEQTGRLVVLLFLDLDEFKVVNDSLGHDVGDRLLVAVAERLRHALRPADTIARFGGDEFTILCEGVHEEDARLVAERILALFDGPFHIGDIEVFESASIGIAVGTHSARPSDLLQQADAAMYRAKDGGGNRYVFFESHIGRRVDARLATYTALRRAVDEQQLQVRYQPIVSIQDGSLAGIEALVRWQHPTGVLLPPQDFIDLAEDTGLIVPLGAFVLHTALLDLRQLSLNGASPRISVNVSARQLTSQRFSQAVRRSLEESGVTPQRLSLEITESVLLTRSSAVYAVINELKSIGVSLSLDDFGTGHSSLDYLRRVPVDEVKIDRRFIADLLTSRQSRAIVSAVIRLAHDLGLQVVAEGIEQADQAACLADLGCDLAQGFYYSPPLPAGEVLRRTAFQTV